MNAITIRAVDFSYGQLHHDSGAAKALDGVTVSIARGDFVAVLGSKGSGKSTFIKLCNALLTPTVGAVCIHGLDSSDASQAWEIRSRSGMIFPDPDSQIIGATVAEDVAFGPENLGLSPQVIQSRVRAALLTVGLEQFADSATHHLSDLQKLRLSLAGVLAMEPDCILFDGATALLDPAGRREIAALLQSLNRERGITIVQVTRDREEAVTADRIIVLDGGKIVFDATPAQLLSSLPGIEEADLELTQEVAHLSAPQATKNCATLFKKMTGLHYSPGGSILHRSDPRTKIALTLLLMTAAFILKSFTALLLLLAIVLALASSSGKPLQQSLRGLKLICYLAVVAVAVNLVSIKGTPVIDYGVLRHVSREAIAVSATMLLRIILLASAASLVTFTTTPLALAGGLERLLKPLNRIGIPVSDLAMMLLIALRFLPVIVEEAEKLIQAQQARSVDFNRGSLLQRTRSYLPLFIPLFAGVARKGDALATAMDARCYRGSAVRTRMQPLVYSRADLACVAVMMIICSLAALVEIR